MAAERQFMPSAIIDELATYGPDHCPQLDYDAASAYTRRLARTHYENFTVVSWMLPRALRDDFSHVYAFCRWADDLGDETGDPVRSVALLTWWREELDACYRGTPRHPVFVALAPTIRRHDVPRQPFDDLIDAFLQDQRVHRYGHWDQVLDYCTRSANPVGRLVLYLCGYRDARRQALSDATCTALQLTNFWQDVRRDVVERDRVYIPQDVATAHGLDVAAMVAAIGADAKSAVEASGACCSARPLPSVGTTAVLPAYRDTLRDLVQRTWPLFRQGRGLWPLVGGRLRTDVSLFTRGGESILRMIERAQYDTLQRRPRLSRGRKVALMMAVATGSVTGWWRTASRVDDGTPPPE